MSDTPQASPLAQFSERLQATAKAVSAIDKRELTMELKPALAGQHFSGGSSAATMLSPSDLPAECVALSISRYTLILGVLPSAPSPEAIQECVRRYRNQAVVARSYLSPAKSLDLLLYFVGPRGSEVDSKWDALAKGIERDDRVARKLVWLRPENPMDDEQSYDRFIMQTFLARPWVQPGDFDDVELDKLTNPRDRTDGVPKTIIAAWEDAVLDKVIAPDEIVEELIKAWASGRAA